MLPEAVFETDAELTISYANRKAFELFGYAGKFSDNGLHILDLIVPEDRERARSNIEERIQDKKKAAAKYHALRKDGTVFPVLIHANAIRKDGKIVGLRGVIVDLTEREQVEAEILKLRKLESVGVLAGGIAHDFNNLLTSIFGNLELAKRFLSPDHKSYAFLDAAGQSMENATNLTKQLLTFAKGGEPVKEVLAIGRILVETAQFSLRGSKVALQTRIAPDLLPVEVDKGQLNQVITNLVINAQQAMPTGGIIDLTAENINISGSWHVKIVMQDEGVGIAPQYLDKIFDPYFSTKQQGSGLGLASVHSIIVKHGGSIKVDSILNQGTTFTIYLPATERKEKMIGGELTAKGAVVLEPNVRVLVMDDEEVVREVLGAMLEAMGHEVMYTVHGREAVEKYRQAWESNVPYDLVIMDLTVPGGMGGQEATAEILKIDPRAKVIVSSGYSTDPVMAHYTAHGFAGRVGKPYHFASLQAVIQQVLKNSRKGKSESA
jgi:PAS domain S-box-containing protein